MRLDVKNNFDYWSLQEKIPLHIESSSSKFYLLVLSPGQND
jgi:hypothetical protein